MSNIVITWNGNDHDTPAVYDPVTEELVSPAIPKDGNYKIIFEDGKEKILKPGQCFGIAAGRKFSVEAVDG